MRILHEYNKKETFCNFIHAHLSPYVTFSFTRCIREDKKYLYSNFQTIVVFLSLLSVGVHAVCSGNRLFSPKTLYTLVDII